MNIGLNTRLNVALNIALNLGLILIITLVMAGCQQADTVNTSHDTQSKQSIKLPESVFVGCYTVSKSEPAQIKISQQGEVLSMQMKEVQPADNLWDNPEPLEPLPMSDISQYFSIDPQQVQVTLARPDRVLVMAHINPDYVNLNPQLDSEYLAFIYQGANTIYKVDCNGQGK